MLEKIYDVREKIYQIEEEISVISDGLVEINEPLQSYRISNLADKLTGIGGRLIELEAVLVSMKRQISER